MNAVQEIFTSAVLRLCLFHVLAAVDKRLSQAKLRRNLREEIYKKFEEAVYATSEEILRECEAFLCGLGKNIFNLPIFSILIQSCVDEGDEDGTYDGLGHYFKTHWFNITE